MTEIPSTCAHITFYTGVHIQSVHYKIKNYDNMMPWHMYIFAEHTQDKKLRGRE